MESPILVSACLLGICCRYDGRSSSNERVQTWAMRGDLVPICPEVAGGLAVPRMASEIEEAHAGLDGHQVLAGRTRVLRSDGQDVTAQFVAGAQLAANLVQSLGIRKAILKANSPSCGAGAIYDGSFRGTLVPGNGVTAALLREIGVDVMTELSL